MPHTPGPWKWPLDPSDLRSKKGDTILGSLQGPDGGSVLHVDYCDGMIAAYEFADARLIAQAPAMYELLKEISDRSVFTDTSGLPIAMCLFCGAIGRGHEKDCRLAAVLKAVEGECPPPNTTD